MFTLTLVLVAMLVTVAAVAISLIAFMRKRLWVRSLTEFTDLVVFMVHQFRIDEMHREYNFQQEQNLLKEIAEEQRKQRTANLLQELKN